MKAIFRIFERSGRDTTQTYAELLDIVNNEGESDYNHALWDLVNEGKAGVNSNDYKVLLGAHPVEIFGKDFNPPELENGDEQEFVLDLGN